MKKTTTWMIKTGIVIGMYLVGFFLFDSLPDILPTHWNASGVADGFMPKGKAVLLFPSIALGTLLLFYFLPKIDPFKKSYKRFERAWEILQITVLSLFAYFYFVSLYSALNPEVSLERYVIGGIGILFVILGNYMNKFKRNFFVAIRTPWTLSNEKVWNKTHRLGGWCFVTAGIILLLQTLLQTPYSVTIMIIAIAVAAIIPIVYSGVIYYKLKSKNQL